MIKRVFSFLLCGLLFSTTIIPPAFANEAQFPDISTSYAKESIINLTENDVISGYTDGTFRPNSYITRGEMAVLIDNLIKYKYESINPFIDLDNAFYTSSILKLNYAEVMIGNTKKEVSPRNYITKEETAAILCRAFQIDTKENDLYIFQFNDWEKIGNWSKPYFSALVRNGYLNPKLAQFNTLNSKDYITREDFVYLLNNIVSVFIKDSSIKTVSNKIYKENVIICKNDVVFNGCKFEGNLYISPSVDIDTIVFNNCKINKIINLKSGIITYQGEEDTEYQNILMEYTIPFDKTNEQLITNLNKCADEINNTVLSANETFSFKEIINNVSVYNGYEVGPEYYSKGKEDTVGGGICQISSLLFTLALNSGCEIIERKSHDSLPDYIAPGTDADVFHKNSNLRFKNTYKVPIKIKIDVNNSGIITAYFCTKSNTTVKNVKVSTYKDENDTWITRQYINNSLKYTTKSNY